MSDRIPSPLIGVLAPILARVLGTHAALDSAFMNAGAPEPVPSGGLNPKALAWLQQINAASTHPLVVVGDLLGQLFETERLAATDRESLERVLARLSLEYQPVGKLVRTGRAGMAPASRTLADLIAGREWEGVEAEFARALSKVENEPAEAASAACNIVESLLKTYLEAEGHGLPAKKDIGGLWDATKRHLGLDPASMPDTDMKAIVGGLGTVAGGIGALRTHASSAHGQAGKVYRLAPRHARLAINAAHTIATFVIETWDAKRQSAAGPNVGGKTT